MGGKQSYSGPSAYEIDQQNEAYRSQWDLEAEQKIINAELEDKIAEEEAASDEVNSREGVSNTLANSQVGFTKKQTDEDEDFMIGL